MLGTKALVHCACCSRGVASQASPLMHPLGLSKSVTSPLLGLDTKLPPFRIRQPAAGHLRDCRSASGQGHLRGMHFKGKPLVLAVSGALPHELLIWCLARRDQHPCAFYHPGFNCVKRGHCWRTLLQICKPRS